MQLDDVVDLPLNQFEIFATSPREVSLIEIGSVGMFEIAREVAGGIGELVSLVADQQVVATSEGRSVGLEAANGFILE